MISKVHIETVHHNGRTWLKDLYCSPPFRIADISGKRPVHLRLMQMSSSPGILDGDVFHFNIHLNKNSVASLETQAYQRLYKMKGSAEQAIEIHLEENTFFEFLPHPTVPHAGANFKSKINISMTASSRLLYGEIYTCGRTLCDEIFQFNRIYAETSIQLDGRLIAKEKLIMDSKSSLFKTGMMEGFTHHGSMFLIDKKFNLDLFIETVRQELLIENSSISKINNDGLSIRIMGTKAEPLFQFFQMVASLYKKMVADGR